MADAETRFRPRLKLQFRGAVITSDAGLLAYRELDNVVAESWLLTSLREKLIKIGAKVVSRGRDVAFQMAGVAVSGQIFHELLMLIARLRAPPAPA